VPTKKELPYGIGADGTEAIVGRAPLKRYGGE
jgi:hypothetical protein